MNFFTFLLQISIITLVLSFLWQYVAAGLGLLFYFVRFEKGVYLVKATGYYLITALLAIVTLNAIQDSTNLFLSLLFILIGGLLVYVNIGGGMYEGRKQALEELGYFRAVSTLEYMKYDTYFLMASVILFFLIVLFVPQLAFNPLTDFAISVISWISRIPIIGLIVGFFGLLAMLNYLFMALLMGGFLVAEAYSKITGKKSEKQSKPAGLDIQQADPNQNTGEAGQGLKIVCDSCGKSNASEATYCKYCGNKL